MRRQALPVLAAAIVTALTVGGCRPEPEQPRALMALDDERRESARPQDKPAPLPDEPRPAEWGGSGAGVGMLVDGAPAATRTPSERPAPIPDEPPAGAAAK
jgi:hypothetical protein